MKKIIILIIAVITLHFVIGTASATEKPTDWSSFSASLVRTLTSPNEGLQLSAMTQIIKYADHLDVDNAVFNVMRIYREHENEKTRQLALTTLYKMKNKWAINYLRRAVLFEESPVLKKHIFHILKECDQKTVAKLDKRKDDVMVAHVE
jgi:hypothetical protein